MAARNWRDLTGQSQQEHMTVLQAFGFTNATTPTLDADLTSAYAERKASQGGGSSGGTGSPVPGKGASSTSLSGNLTKSQLQQLWIQAGGNPAQANMASAIAMAESGGRDVVSPPNTDGSLDRGYWQINSSHGSQSTLDPLGNARAAIAISSNGTNWKPWVTFNSGAYRQFL